jgi:hypothetical protein
VRLGELVLAALVLGEAQRRVHVAGLSQRTEHALGAKPGLDQEVGALALSAEQLRKPRRGGEELVVHPPLPDDVLDPDRGSHQEQGEREQPGAPPERKARFPERVEQRVHRRPALCRVRGEPAGQHP